LVNKYCRIQRNWRLGLSLSSKARCGRIFLKFLHNNLALIYIHFCQLENFSDQRRFFWNVEKKKWSSFLEYLRNGQLERNFLCYESYRKNLFGCFTYSGVQSINNVYDIVNKVENVCVYQYIFNLIDIGVYVVYALYSSIGKTVNFHFHPLLEFSDYGGYGLHF
jgi:hypothetical protein